MEGVDLDDVDADGQRPGDGDGGDGDAEYERDAGAQRGVGSALPARGQGDECHEREQAGDEGVDRTGTVVEGDAARVLEEEIGRGQGEEDGETADDPDERGDPQVVHITVWSAPQLNRGVVRRPVGQVAAAESSRNGHKRGPGTTTMVGLGDTKKKIEKMISAAEDLYEKMNQLRAQIEELRETVEHTSETVDAMEHDIAEQQVLLERLAEEQGIDVDEVLAAAAIEDATPGAAEDGGADGATDTGAEATDAAGGSAAEPED